MSKCTQDAFDKYKQDLKDYESEIISNIVEQDVFKPELLNRFDATIIFHPLTKGSNSIKKVLPAIMTCSDYIKEKYSSPIYGAKPGMTSLNFSNQIWWQSIDGNVLDPYKLLPPVFNDVSESELEQIESGDEFEISQGGAASTAYARLQFEDLPDSERTYIKDALLRYCELDTLAMVMIFEAWNNTYETGAMK